MTDLAESKSGQAFRKLRVQLEELSGLCTALTESGNVRHLWRRVVHNAQVLLNVDGCSYYRIVDGMLKPEVMLTQSLGIFTEPPAESEQYFSALPLVDDSQPVDRFSVAAQVAHSGELINIPNVALMRHYNESRTREFEEITGYHTVSMLTLPVCFHDRPVIGVLQLINAKDTEGELVDFDGGRQIVARALASCIALADQVANGQNQTAV